LAAASVAAIPRKWPTQRARAAGSLIHRCRLKAGIAEAEPSKDPPL
jgi:hypothetical protein